MSYVNDSTQDMLLSPKRRQMKFAPSGANSQGPTGASQSVSPMIMSNAVPQGNAAGGYLSMDKPHSYVEKFQAM